MSQDPEQTLALPLPAAAPGQSTPPREPEAMLPEEGDGLILGGHYWMEDDTGDEVWRLAEVMERGEGGNVSIKLEAGGVMEIDPVSERRKYSELVCVCHRHRRGVYNDFQTSQLLSSASHACMPLGPPPPPALLQVCVGGACPSRVHTFSRSLLFYCARTCRCQCCTDGTTLSSLLSLCLSVCPVVCVV